MGKSGVFLNYVHALMTVHDSTGYGKNFRYPFEAIALLTPSVTGCTTTKLNWGCFVNQLQQIMQGTDNREYLMGYVTVPISNSLDGNSGNLGKYYSAIINGGGGRVDYTTNGPTFTKGEPQIIFDESYAQKIWGKPYGCGQLRWNKGEKDNFTGQVLKCENPWLNPMDDNGRLEYLGKKFVQFYYN